MRDSEAEAMSDRDILLKVANDSEHTRKSVDKLWDKSDELSSTMAAVRTNQKTHGSTLEKIDSAVFTGDRALVPRVKVLEQHKKGGSSGQFKLSIPPSGSANTGAYIKTMGGVIMALIAIIAGVLVR